MTPFSFTSGRKDGGSSFYPGQAKEYLKEFVERYPKSKEVVERIKQKVGDDAKAAEYISEVVEKKFKKALAPGGPQYAGTPDSLTGGSVLMAESAENSERKKLKKKKKKDKFEVHKGGPGSGKPKTGEKDSFMQAHHNVSASVHKTTARKLQAKINQLDPKNYSIKINELKRKQKLHQEAAELKKSEEVGAPMEDVAAIETVDITQEANMNVQDSINDKTVQMVKNKTQLEMGVEVEKEHSETIKEVIKDAKTDKLKPLGYYLKGIAKDHIAEIRDYYTRLKTIESDVKKGKNIDPFIDWFMKNNPNADEGGLKNLAVQLGIGFDELKKKINSKKLV